MAYRESLLLFAVVAIADSITVPGAPSAVYVEVLSQSRLKVEFEPPADDGALPLPLSDRDKHVGGEG